MRDNPRNDDNLIESLFRTNREQAQQFEDIWNKLPSAPVLNHRTQVPTEPWQGMFVVNPVERAFCFYLGEQWYCVYGGHPPVHAIKVNSDKKANAIAAGAFKFNVEFDLDNHYITQVEAFNGTAGSGATTVQITKNGVDILSTPLTIASGQLHDNGAAVINQALNQVSWKDVMWIDIDAAGSGSKGLGVYITFHPAQIEEEEV